MAVLIDLTQVLISGVMTQLGATKTTKVQEGMVRHLALNILRSHVKQFRKEYGEVVLCCDNKKYWRKEYFPFYKIHRKKNRDASPLDWNIIFGVINQIKEDLKENFPYKVIDVDGAEADDVIGVLAPRMANNEKVLIISSDSDFLQLQKYKGVSQYNPVTKKKMVSKNPQVDLKTKIVSGDRGDGIPNMLSPHDCFAKEVRQKPLTAKKLEELLNTDITEEHMSYGYYMRNKTLIDFDHIPPTIRENIVSTYDTVVPSKNMMKLMNYLSSHKLKALFESIEEF